MVVHPSQFCIPLLILACIVQHGQAFVLRKYSPISPMNLLQKSSHHLHRSPRRVSASASFLSSAQQSPKWASVSTLRQLLPTATPPTLRIPHLLPKVRIGTILRVIKLFRSGPSVSGTLRPLFTQVDNISQATAQLAALAGLYKLVNLSRHLTTPESGGGGALGTVARLLQVPLEIGLLGGGMGGQNAVCMYKGMAVSSFAKDLGGWARLLVERPFKAGQFNYTDDKDD
jgi:hypothetical protein